MSQPLEDIRKHVEAALDQAVRNNEGWQAQYRPRHMRLTATGREPRDDHDFWFVSQESSNGYYILELSLESDELLLWFGHYQAGADVLISSLFWPAVHIPFQNLWPDADLLTSFTLADVLRFIIISEGGSQPLNGMRYPRNYVSLT